MVNIAIIDLNTDTIQTVYEDDAPNQSKFGGPWGWPHATVHLEIPEDIESDVAGVVKQQDGLP